MEVGAGSSVRTARRYAARMLVCAATVMAAGCGGAAGPTCGTGAGAGACTRVLFLGNSFTYVNDLPSTFAQLSKANGRPVDVDMVANGGETLAQHAASSDDTTRISSQQRRLSMARGRLRSHSA